MPPITELRFLKKANVEATQKLFKNYYHDLIHSYGIDVVYFRKDLSFYEVPSGLADYTYGEDTTSTYFLSANMVIFQEQVGDAFLLNKFGIDTNADATIYMTLDDFTEQFRSKIGTPASAFVVAPMEGYVYSNEAVLSAQVFTADMSGMTSSSFTASTSGTYAVPYSGTVNPFQLPVNADIKNVTYYDYGNRKMAGTMRGEVTVTVDASGNGSYSGECSGELAYFVKPAVNAGPFWDIAPQVGDFFRLFYPDGTEEDYEITQVADRDLMADGLNPLMSKYIWKCNATRRDPSYEEGPDKTVASAEENTTSTLDLETNRNEVVSDQIFDYTTEAVDTTDGPGSDDVYGKY